MRLMTGVAALIGTMALAGSAAAAGLGQPDPWQMGLQQAASPIMERITSLHDGLLWLITIISLFVLILLIYVAMKFNAKANPEPSKTTHNTAIEVAWTVIPVLILLAIAIPSFRLLYFQRVIPEADMTIKAIGNQWYWSYEYPDHNDVSFDSLLLEGEDLAERRKIDPGAPRLLAVDNEVVVPVGKTIRVIVTASDVIHNFAVPSFGTKMDGIPGRVNETWFKVDKEGVYYGQCSELCGIKHAYMPIAVRVVSQAKFDTWVKGAEDDVDDAQLKLLATLADDKKKLATSGQFKLVAKQ
ncbi:MAG: cytochrome c oxidase subunit II [Alphaproteobacteria bacterium]|nr:cytochrome c oxidase subunit II [Alphaproteobacteria bacterium]